jgi:hypothetical protein
MRTDLVSRSRRQFLVASAGAGAAGLAAAATLGALAAGPPPSADPAAIRPFHLHAPDAALADMSGASLRPAGQGRSWWATRPKA